MNLWRLLCHVAAPLNRAGDCDMIGQETVGRKGGAGYAISGELRELIEGI